VSDLAADGCSSGAWRPIRHGGVPPFNVTAAIVLRAEGVPHLSVWVAVGVVPKPPWASLGWRVRVRLALAALSQCFLTSGRFRSSSFASSHLHYTCQISIAPCHSPGQQNVR